MTASNSTTLTDFTESLVPATVSMPVEKRGGEANYSFADVPALTAALRAGDDHAFRWVHAQWNARLGRYCFALAAGDDTFAADIAQATYLRLARHIRVLPTEAALWNWIALAARCAAAELRRNGGRYRRALARFSDWLALRSSRDAPDADSEMLAALDSALALLSTDEHALVELRYVDRLTLEEIAGRFGNSTRAIEGRLARLRARLRKTIASTLLSQESTT